MSKSVPPHPAWPVRGVRVSDDGQRVIILPLGANPTARNAAARELVAAVLAQTDAAQRPQAAPRVIPPGIHWRGIRIRRETEFVDILPGWHICLFTRRAVTVHANVGTLNIRLGVRFVVWSGWRVTVVNSSDFAPKP